MKMTVGCTRMFKVLKSSDYLILNCLIFSHQNQKILHYVSSIRHVIFGCSVKFLIKFSFPFEKKICNVFSTAILQTLINMVITFIFLPLSFLFTTIVSVLIMINVYLRISYLQLHSNDSKAISLL